MPNNTETVRQELLQRIKGLNGYRELWKRFDGPDDLLDCLLLALIQGALIDEERHGLAEKLEQEIRPLIDKDKHQGGYDCCGCSTYDTILDHAIAIVRGEQFNRKGPDD